MDECCQECVGNVRLGRRDMLGLVTFEDISIVEKKHEFVKNILTGFFSEHTLPTTSVEYLYLFIYFQSQLYLFILLIYKFLGGFFKSSLLTKRKKSL